MPVSPCAPAPGGAGGRACLCDDCFEGCDEGGPVGVGAAERGGLPGCRRGRRVDEPGRGPRQRRHSGRVGAVLRRGQVRIAHRAEPAGQQVGDHSVGVAGRGGAGRCGVPGPCGIDRYRGEEGVQELPIGRHVSGEPAEQTLVLVDGRFEPPLHHSRFGRFHGICHEGRRWCRAAVVRSLRSGQSGRGKGRVARLRRCRADPGLRPAVGRPVQGVGVLRRLTACSSSNREWSRPSPCGRATAHTACSCACSGSSSVTAAPPCRGLYGADSE